MSAKMNMTGFTLHGHMKAVTMLKYNTDGDLLFSSSKDLECPICVWYTKTGELLGSYGSGDSEGQARSKAVAAFDVNYWSTLLATTTSGEDSQIWSVETGALLGTINRPNASGSAVGFSHDDTKLMISTKGRSQTNSAISLFNLPFASPSDDKDIAPAKTVFNPCAEFLLEDPKEKINFALWGPTNDTIYFATDTGDMHILDVERMTIVQKRNIHSDGAINRFHFDPNYLTLITASDDQTARLLDSRDMHLIQTYESDTPVNDASISPCGDHIILGGGMDAQDVTTQGGQSKFEVKFYHKVHGTQLGQIRCHFGTINAATFQPDGLGFASGSFDGLIKMFRFDKNYTATPGAVPIWSVPRAV